MTIQLPFASREIRWFFEGPLSDFLALEDWFCRCAPFQKADDAGTPKWQPRRADEPDVYLLLPGQEDMGIKWREGLLQIKGLVESLGQREFLARHVGTVERWIKWSYRELPEGYADLFASPAVEIVAVHKVRALRLLDLAPDRPIEVSPDTWLDVGMTVELTRIVVGDRDYCSLGFEAFPDPVIAPAIFDDTVAAFLYELAEPLLGGAQSMSYPAWLHNLSV